MHRRKRTIKAQQKAFEDVIAPLTQTAQAINESLLEPDAELRACDDSWRYYSAHLQLKDRPVKIRPCEIYHAVC